MDEENEVLVKSIVKRHTRDFARNFKSRHLEEYTDPDGTINMKIHNYFISELGSDIQYYTSLARSLDSSLGNMLEAMAIDIAKLNYSVSKQVSGQLFSQQTSYIADLLEKYKRHAQKPTVSDYLPLRSMTSGSGSYTRHETDYYLYEKETDEHHLIELKIGGDLDNKKARSEKEAILEQYCILSNTLENSSYIDIKFATAYNRYGEDKEWKQERVKQYFAKDELLIGKEFWNFVSKSTRGNEWVLEAYRESSPVLKDSLEEIKKKYLG